MKKIEVQLPPDAERVGRRWVFPVVVAWFEPLTKDQVLQNSLADLDGRPRPHENPNMIEVVVTP